MEKLLALLDLQDKDSLKNLLVMGLTKGEHALEGKLGIDIPDGVPGSIAEVVVKILDAATALKQARVEGANAAAKVETPADADRIIGQTPGGGIVTGLMLALVMSVSLMSSSVMAQPADAPVRTNVENSVDEVTALTPIPVAVAVAPATIDRSSELAPLTTGQPAPFDGRLYSNKLHIDVAKRIVNCETTLKAVEPKVGMPAWQVALIAIGAALAAAAVAVPVTVAVTKNPK